MTHRCRESGSRVAVLLHEIRRTKREEPLGQRHWVLTTGQRTLNGLDLVIEGTAQDVSDHVELGRVAATYESKYRPHFAAPDGTWSGLDDAIRRSEVLVYRVAPETGFGFSKGASFSQTRWSF
jgi:hypothetical protein